MSIANYYMLNLGFSCKGGKGCNSFSCHMNRSDCVVHNRLAPGFVANLDSIVSERMILALRENRC